MSAKVGDRWSDTIRELNDTQAELFAANKRIEKLTDQLDQALEKLADKEDLWDRASRQANTLAEYLVDAKAELSVANDQLAAAQAELTQARKWWDVRLGEDEAIAAATKPFVDALTQIADEKRHGAAAWRIAKDALAQVK